MFNVLMNINICDLFQGVKPGAGPTPPVEFDSLISLLPGVIFDYSGWGQEFGEVLKQPAPTARINGTVSATFVSNRFYYYIINNQV